MRLSAFRQSLLGQFVVHAVLPSVLVLAAVIAVNGMRGYAALQAMAERTAIAEATAVANEIEAWNIEATSVVKVLSDAADAGLFGDRAGSLRLMRRVMDEYPDLEACYYTYAPNADGRDAAAIAAARTCSATTLAAARSR
jgi:hypothetical protein